MLVSKRNAFLVAAFAAVAAVVVCAGVALTATVGTSSNASSAPLNAKSTTTSPTPDASVGAGSEPAQAASAQILAKSSAVPVPAAPSSLPEIAARPAKVITIGDSIMRGSGVSTDQAWPAILGADVGWNVSNLSCGGAGFLAIGDPLECDSDYSGIIASMDGMSPDIIIVCGSSNDFGQNNGELAARTTADLASLRSRFPLAQIIALSTVWSDTAPPAQLADVDSQVRDAVGRVNGTYVDIAQPLGGHPELMQADDVHPTADGQLVLAAAIEAGLAAARDSASKALRSETPATGTGNPAPTDQ